MRNSAVSQNRNGTGRHRRLLAAAVVAVGISVAAVGAASAAAPVSKTKITAPGCTTTGCPLTATITATVKATPTGTVSFSIGGVAIGTCQKEALGTVTATRARAVCSTTGLAAGSHKVTVTYSGDSNFDYNITSRSIRVKSAS